MKMGPDGRALCQAEEADLDSVVHGEINPAAEPWMDCRKEGQEAERPVRTLLENPSMRGSGCTGESGGRGGGRGEGRGHW